MKKVELLKTESNRIEKPILSIQECKLMLNKYGDNFSDDDVRQIRDFLYIIAEIDYNHFQNHIKAKAEHLLLETENNVKIIPLQLNSEDKNELLKTG